jgi:hypothetical protein
MEQQGITEKKILKIKKKLSRSPSPGYFYESGGKRLKRVNVAV